MIEIKTYPKDPLARDVTIKTQSGETWALQMSEEDIEKLLTGEVIRIISREGDDYINEPIINIRVRYQKRWIGANK